MRKAHFPNSVIGVYPTPPLDADLALADPPPGCRSPLMQDAGCTLVDFSSIIVQLKSNSICIMKLNKAQYSWININKTQHFQWRTNYQ